MYSQQKIQKKFYLFVETPVAEVPNVSITKEMTIMKLSE